MERSFELPRRVGLLSAMAVLIGTTIGSGIFRTPARIAERLPGPVPMLTVWVVAGIIVLCGALTLAEVGGAFPRTGGLYAYIKEGWGKLPAFLFGWTELVLLRAAALGAIATTFAEYLLRLLGGTPGMGSFDQNVHYVAAVAIAVAASVNVVGVRWGTLTQNLTTMAKYGGLLFIVIVGLALGLPRGGHFTPAVPAGSFALTGFGLALVSVFWAYDGWADLSFMGGEVKDPRRNLPRALILGTLAVIVIYVLANIAYLAVLPVEEIRRSPLVAADVAQRLIGAAGVTFVSLTVMVSTYGTLNGSTMTSPRIFKAMSDDGLFFKRVAAVHPTFQTPYVAIMMAATLGIIFVMVRTFEQLADTFVISILPFYALSVAAVFTLRRRADYQPPFRVPLYPVVPALYVLTILLVLGNAIADPASRWGTLGVLGVILVGVPVYYATVGRRKARLERGGTR